MRCYLRHKLCSSSTKNAPTDVVYLSFLILPNVQTAATVQKDPDVAPNSDAIGLECKGRRRKASPATACVPFCLISLLVVWNYAATR